MGVRLRGGGAMWIFMSLGVGLHGAPQSVGSPGSVHSMAGGAPLRLIHQRDERVAILPSSHHRVPVRPSQETAAPRWTGPVIDQAIDQGPVVRGQLIDILV